MAKRSNSASCNQHVKCVSEPPLLWQNLGVMLNSHAQGYQTPFANAAKGLSQATLTFPHVSARLDLVKSLEVKSDHGLLNGINLLVCLNDVLSLPARM